MNTGIEELREQMEHATAGIAVPGGLARRAVQHRRRRILTRATAAAATAVVVAGVAIAATTAAPRDGGTIASARLVSDIRSALDAAAAGDDIMQVRIQNHLAEAWYYQNAREILTRSEIFSASGQPGFDQGYAATSTSVTHTSVSYPAKTWSTSTVKAGKLRPPGQPGLRGTCLAAICLDLMQDPGTLTSDIREALSHGQLTRDGTEDINGINAIKLVAVVTKPQASGQFAFVGRTTLWVNPATYLPVRINTNLTATLGHGQTTHIVGTRDVSWLPATSANLADLRVPIPAGFTQVSRR
jgi:hypothetical protein